MDDSKKRRCPNFATRHQSEKPDADFYAWHDGQVVPVHVTNRFERAGRQFIELTREGSDSPQIYANDAVTGAPYPLLMQLSDTTGGEHD